MKKNLLRLACAALALLICGACAACAGEGGDSNMDKDDQTQTAPPDDTPDPAPTWETQTEGRILTRPQSTAASRREILTDLNFSRGFNVTLFHSNSSNGNLAGQLTYGGEKAEGDPAWQMAQWGCTHDMTDGTYTRDGGVLSYTDGAKTLTVDVCKTGAVTMGIKGSEEYTRDADGDIRERTDPAENWPHILIEQSLSYDISPEAQHLYMEVQYEVTSCVSLVDREKYPVDPDVNAAQFQWFITLTDTDETSESFGSTMWFGFSMFDTRAEGGTPSGMSAYDGGKEDATGLFIYMPSLEQAAMNKDNTVTLPSAVVGKQCTVKFDILPFLSAALKIARQQGAMTGASTDHLRIGSTNIGWELPGNYDAEVKISYLNMYEVL